MVLSIILFIVGVLFLVLSGASDAVRDKILFHYDNSIFSKLKKQQFFNPEISWKNKYKSDLKTPRFFLSTKSFVFVTDAVHLSKWLRNRFTEVGFLSIGFASGLLLPYGFIVALACLISVGVFGALSFSISFEKFFSKVYQLKKEENN